MKNKLIAIWNIIVAEHYLVLTSGGNLTACYPTKMKSSIRDLAEALQEQLVAKKLEDSPDA